MSRQSEGECVLYSREGGAREMLCVLVNKVSESECVAERSRREDHMVSLHWCSCSRQ